MDEIRKDDSQGSDGPEKMSRRDFLLGAKGWSMVVAGLVIGAAMRPRAAEAGWTNWHNGRGWTNWHNTAGGNWHNTGGWNNWHNGGWNNAGWHNWHNGGAWSNTGWHNWVNR